MPWYHLHRTYLSYMVTAFSLETGRQVVRVDEDRSLDVQLSRRKQRFRQTDPARKPSCSTSLLGIPRSHIRYFYIRAYSNGQSIRTAAHVEAHHVRKRRSPAVQGMAGSFKSRLRLSACRIRPRERRRHNANPCFAVGPVNQNRSSRQGKLFGSLSSLSCHNTPPLST
jgi:hypothetical protein